MSTSSPSHERYAIPVFRLNDADGPANPQTTDADAGGSVLVRYEDSQVDNPELRVTYTSAGTTDHYRFRVTDPEKQWCAYVGDTPTDLPVPVQHAVHAFGYGITDPQSLDDRLFDWLEAMHLITELEALETEFEDLPLFHAAIGGAASALYSLAGVLLARSGLPDTDYWRAWDEVLDTNGPDERPDRGAVGDRFWETARESALGDRLMTTAGGIQCQRVITLSEVSAADGEYVMADLVTEFGIKRFPFRRTSAETCVYERTATGRAPPGVVAALQADGYTITNTDTVAQAETPCAVVDTAVRFCDEHRERALLPPEVTDTPADVITDAYEGACAAGVLLAVLDANERAVRALHTTICERYGITARKQLTPAVVRMVLPHFLESVPGELRQELRDDADWAFLPERETPP